MLDLEVFLSFINDTMCADTILTSFMLQFACVILNGLRKRKIS
jgi:hypothetical protein